MEIVVNSPNVKYTDNYIEANYDYYYSKAVKNGNKIEITPITEELTIRTQRNIPRIGVMLIGWGGNNGSTFTAGILANKYNLKWQTKRGEQNSNWYGSLTQASTVRITDDIFIQLSKLLPTVHPNDIEIDGWDISSLNLYEAMDRAQVLEPLLKQQLKNEMLKMKPKPSIYDSDFIAINQVTRADNVIKGNKMEQIQQICLDIEDFRKRTQVKKVILLWTANTERYTELIKGVNDTEENLYESILNNHTEISPSTLFAYAAIKMNCIYINGSPQNTFVPGIIEMAEKSNGLIAGDDFKSGQTKIKSVLVDFLVSAGIKPTSIVSYNHLGNNDGKNLSAPKQFRSKEISKSNVVDDMVESNDILYKSGEKPDHTVVIKYVPFVGDSKRAMDEYTSEIMLGGLNTIAIHNTCEDSLLATPIILDLIILAELCTRIEIKPRNASDKEFVGFHSILSLLSYLLKAPLVPPGTPVINALFKQRACIENIMRACIGLPPDSNMLLEHKVPFLMSKNINGKRVDYDKKFNKKKAIIENGNN